LTAPTRLECWSDPITVMILRLFLFIFHAPIAVMKSTGAPWAPGPCVFLELIVLSIHREKAPS
jgi:hypothetical protein